MKNLEQIRAKNALLAAKIPMSGANGGNLIKDVPPLIMNHGLLAVGAYASEDKNKQGYGRAFSAIAAHLADSDIGRFPFNEEELGTEVKRWLVENNNNLMKAIQEGQDEQQKKNENNAEELRKALRTQLIDYLVDSNSVQLRLCTQEALAWLTYARRFVKNDGGGQQ